uniref:Uncharacterized protein n=1 Tax=Cacopsylla melanoneura TaxID=428564 RepID=A0A8D8SQX1_9HEMI
MVLYKIASLVAGVGAGCDINSQYQRNCAKKTAVTNGGEDNASYLDPESESSSSHVPFSMHNTYHGPTKHHRPALLLDVEDSQPFQHFDRPLTRRRKSSTTSTENADLSYEQSEYKLSSLVPESHHYPTSSVTPSRIDAYSSNHLRDNYSDYSSSSTYISGRNYNHRRTPSNLSNSSSCSNAGYLEEPPIPPIDYYNTSSTYVSPSIDKDRRRMAGDYGPYFSQAERPCTLDLGYNPRLRSSLKKNNYTPPQLNSSGSSGNTPTQASGPDSLNSDDSSYLSKDSSYNSVSRVRFSPMRLPRDSSRSRSRKPSVERGDFLS